MPRIPQNLARSRSRPTGLIALINLLGLMAWPVLAQTPAPAPAPAPSPAPPAAVSRTIPALAGTRSDQPVDKGYTARIREYTTEPFFLTEFVDHLPASATVPTTEHVLGYVAGAPGKLTYTADVNRYMRALSRTSPRVRVLSAGRSEEGREMLLVVVSDETNLLQLDQIRADTAALADPRKTPAELAEKLIRRGKVLYWLTGAMHSPETGSPEMLMELAYRLAVEESPYIRNIRKNVVTMITPILETDGRDRTLDVIRVRKKLPQMPLPYWGRYVAHDNNRDGMAMSLALTRNVMKTFLEWHPQVLHDLHESVPFLYTSTGTGPYNAWLDPIVINEWHQFAYHEVNEMAKRGVPGVWTHGFYDGWAPNYMFYVAHGRNAVGRFYETFGNSDPDTRERTVGAQAQRDWFRPNPPLANVRWSLRNNVNMQQSALLLALGYSADHRAELLNNFYLKGQRSVQKARTEGPAGYVLPGDEVRRSHQAEMIALLRSRGVEVHQTAASFKVAEGEFPAGSYVIRMDQPYSRDPDMLLDIQYYNVNDPAPYDDTGWSLGPLRNIRAVRVRDLSLLQVPMTLLTTDPRPAGGVVDRLPPSSAVDRRLVVPATADCRAMTLRMALPDVPMSATEGSFANGALRYPAGSLLIDPRHRERVHAVASRLGIGVDLVPAPTGVPTHPVGVPRIAIVHPWTSTQNEGWWRLGFEQWQVPYEYVSLHALRDTPEFRKRWDVLILAPVYNSGRSLTEGLTGDRPMPWLAQPDTPHLGIPDSSPDMRGGIGAKGLEALKKFVQDGGLLVTCGTSISTATDLGLTPGVSRSTAQGVQARGSVLGAVNCDPSSPILYGYDPRVAVYFPGQTLLKVDGDPDPQVRAAPPATGGPGGRGPAGRATGGRASGRGGPGDPDVIQARPNTARRSDPPEPIPAPVIVAPAKTGPRVVLRFAEEQRLLISGMLSGGEAVAGRAAVVDVPIGKGHVLCFAINPMWRSQTQGLYPMVFNAALHHDHLGVGR